MSLEGPIEWPGGKSFAFTIFDDTDRATLENVAPVYDFLSELGLRTTKSVWVLGADESPTAGGATCEDAEYLAWTRELQARGFEIGSHGATYATSPRERIIEALERFKEFYGHYPMTLANHEDCAENIYWGQDRVSGINRLAFEVLTRFRRAGRFTGHREGDPHFWGDVCRARVRYVRNFTFPETNTLAACPLMPYHDPKRPYVNYWFASSEGGDVRAFNRSISEENQDRLEAQSGACIIYTHFAYGFVHQGTLDPRFKELMEQLAVRNGWFVPVATLLDYLLLRHGPTVLTGGQRRGLERRWLRGKLRTGHS